MFGLDQIKGNLNSVDRQLLFMIYEQMNELNSNLTELLNGRLTSENMQTKETSDTHIQAPQKRGRRPKTA